MELSGFTFSICEPDLGISFYVCLFSFLVDDGSVSIIFTISLLLQCNWRIAILNDVQSNNKIFNKTKPKTKLFDTHTHNIIARSAKRRFVAYVLRSHWRNRNVWASSILSFDQVFCNSLLTIRTKITECFFSLFYAIIPP